jgi:hypothetical protein
VFRLNIYLDILLLIASGLLLVQFLHDRYILKKSIGQSVVQRKSRNESFVHGLYILILVFTTAYIFYPWLCRLSASREEAKLELPGDAIVQNPTQGYTVGITIMSQPSATWPWLLQMGQGRGGFYTHEWVEDILRADIQNADSILPQFQNLQPGDTVWLTPDPYLGKQGQHLIVAQVDSPHAIVYRQVVPNGSVGTWAFVLKEQTHNSTRLLFRRRGVNPGLVDRLAKPGYYFMDNGMLSGIKDRAEVPPNSSVSRHIKKSRSNP